MLRDIRGGLPDRPDSGQKQWKDFAFLLTRPIHMCGSRALWWLHALQRLQSEIGRKARWSCNMKYELARQMPHQMVEGVGTYASMYQPPRHEAASHSKYAEASRFQRGGIGAGFIVPVVQMLGMYGSFQVILAVYALQTERTS